MRRTLLMLLGVVMLWAVSATAQTTAVTLQATDLDGQTWNNGTYIAALVSPAGSQPFGPPFNLTPTFGGGTVPNQLQTGALSVTGGASLTLTSNPNIAPALSQWRFTVCPQATANCFIQLVTISGGAQTVTLTPPAIRINGANAPPTTLAYTDAEIQNQSIGTIYYNLISLTGRQWNGTVWANIAGTGAPGSPGNALQFNNGGTFGGTSTATLPNAATFNSTTGRTKIDFLNGISFPDGTDFNWSAAPAGTLAVGANVVTLALCPVGLQVIGFPTWDNNTQLKIATVGTPEVVTLTATTCPLAGGGAGTITFTAANVHGAGFTVASATAGIQEAINAAEFVPNGYTRTSNNFTIVPPGNYTIDGTITLNTFGPQTLIGFGANLLCNSTVGPCIQTGNLASSAVSNWKVIEGFTFQAGQNTTPQPMIRDNAEHTTIRYIQPSIVRIGTNYFGSMVTVDNDQSANIENISALGGSWGKCDATFCSTAVVGTTGGGNSSVIRLSKSDISAQCGNNGVDYGSANTLSISDTVIQGYPQFGVRANAGFSVNPAVKLSNVYFEVGTCTNPLGIGVAGMIVEGGWARVTGGVGPLGTSQKFANTGGTQYNYYIVVHSSTGATVSAPFLAGYALTNGAGTITAKWWQVGSTGTITYDVIRTSGSLGVGSTAPYTAVCGGGATTTCGSVALALTVGAACVSNVCSFADNAATVTAAYTVANPTFYPLLDFWPSAITYSNTTADASQSSISPGGIFLDQFGDQQTDTTIGVTSNTGALLPRFFAAQCVNNKGGSQIWMSCLDNETSAATAPGATLIQTDIFNGPEAGFKGRYIFEQGLQNQIKGTHRLTIVDSAPAKTLSYSNNRPPYDAADTYIGLDNSGAAVTGANAQLAFGAPISISNYINNVGDGTAWLERLTSALKAFHVEVDLGGAGFGNGVLGWAGNTSGVAKCTAPAIAGTVTNPVTCTNSFAVPAGTGALPSYTFSSDNTTGMNNAGGFLNLAQSGANAFAISNSARMRARSDGMWAWTSTTDPDGTLDTNFTRNAAGWIQAGTTAANRLGFVIAANSLRVTADFTQAANTNLQTITGLSFNAPATAVNLNFHCHLTYTQATAAVASAFGIQAATTAPTNIYAAGIVYTSATASTSGSLLTLATTTATNILTFTPSASATDFVAELWGTLELTAAANVVNVMVSTTNSSDLITIRRGSFCAITP